MYVLEFMLQGYMHLKITLGMSWLSEDLEGKSEVLDNFPKSEHLSTRDYSMPSTSG